MLLLVSFGLLIAVLLPGIGIEVNGARRWIGAGPLQVQPSELMKLALVLYGAAGARRRPAPHPHRQGHRQPPAGDRRRARARWSPSQPDLGTALVIAFTLCALLVAAGMPLRHLALFAGLAAAAVVLFALAEPYRRARLTAFLNPWADAGGAGFQAVQGQIALGSGGCSASGWGSPSRRSSTCPRPTPTSSSR